MKRAVLVLALTVTGCVEPVSSLTTNDPAAIREFIRSCNDLNDSPIIQTYHSIINLDNGWYVSCHALPETQYDTTD